jgi:Ni,Fe-hydrogenase maturation factor
MGMELSPEVENAIPEAVKQIKKLVNTLINR